MDHCEELIPPYLRFIKGVVDSSDLPLNVSREILQNNRQVDIIKANIIKKVLDTLQDMKTEEEGAYAQFYKEFGRVLKEGIHYDFERGETIADLLLFSTTKAEEGKFRSLEEYVKDMKEDQQDIYYATATSMAEVLKSPYMEAFSKKIMKLLFYWMILMIFSSADLNIKGKSFNLYPRAVST